MERRLFLQLLGLTGIAAALPSSKTPLLATEGLPSPRFKYPHYVVDKGSYTGKTLGGLSDTLWLKGENAGFPTKYDMSSKTWTVYREDLKPSTFFYSMKELRQASYVNIPGVDGLTGRALSLFREQIYLEFQELLKVGRAPEDTQLVTLVQSPLTVHHSPKKDNGIKDLMEVRLSYENFLLQGTLKPYRMWSDCGRIPLQTDFADSKELHAWFDQKARENTYLEGTDGRLITASRGNRVA